MAIAACIGGVRAGLTTPDFNPQTSAAATWFTAGCGN
jgi:hypothetical protein